MDTMWDGASFRIFGITPSLLAQPKIPAPLIVCNEGDSVVLNTLSISQTDHHTIHLHGLDVDTRNDGDPATSFYLSHMQDTTYSFRAHHAGSYIYHCHVGDVSHVQMGMYGMIVIKAKNGVKTLYTGGPAYSKDYNWITSEIDKSWHDTIPVHDDKTGRMRIPKYIPDYFLINGKSEWEIKADPELFVLAMKNEPVALRIANIGFYDNMVFIPKHLNPVVYLSDGRVLPNPFVPDSIQISPGERYDILIQPSAEVTDSIRIDFRDMNTSKTANSQFIPVEIKGVFSAVSNVKKELNIQLYPNPVEELLTIKSNENQKLVYFVSDIHGRKYSVGVLEEMEHISMKTMCSGIYFVTVSGDLGSRTLKIIKN